MNEPLNLLKESLWPEWHHKPMRLTANEIENPAIVIDQFFQCYHLPDIRNCLKNWLHDSLAKNTVESKQHVFTHDEVEKLVEAAWVINNFFSASRFKKYQPANSWKYARENRGGAVQKDRYKKKELLIERVAKNPTEAVREVFAHNTLADLLDYLLPNWIRTALINDECHYSGEGVTREILCEFYDQLQLLIQALFIINENNKSTSDKLEDWLGSHERYDRPSLNDDQIANPPLVIASFYEKFSIEYVRRELRDFLDAGIGYAGTYLNGFTPWQAFMAYEDVVCLTEAAYYLYQQMPGNVQRQ